MKEAFLYRKLENQSVHCYLCAHNCRIAEGRFGFCGVRQNVKGVLYTHVYAKASAVNIDPVEKKPLYHFFPGTKTFSIATVGCNFRCGFCQNWEISQRSFRDAAKDEIDAPGKLFLPPDVIKEAQGTGCGSISYTYTEPTIFFEYAFDCAKIAKEKGLANIFVTNGYMTKEALLAVKPYLNAANVDLKSFRDSFYRKICSGSLEPVLSSIRFMKELGVWVEITTLIIPGENDSREELTDIAGFIASLDKNIPWHISRFHPDYQYTGHAVTPEPALRRAYDIAVKCGLRYVYVGNVYEWGNDTYCPQCKKAVIKRRGFSVLENSIKRGKCLWCNTDIAGIF